jgi:acyl-CoA thioesterase-1
MKKNLLTYLIWLLIPMVSFASADPKLLVVGDSLSAGYGVAREHRWVDLMAKQLNHNCDLFDVVNASISGDTSRGGLSRLPALLKKHKPNVVIIELGANDGLRGIAPDKMHANLKRMVKLSKQAGARVLLLGIRLPANYGPDFVQAFHQVYFDVAKAESVPLVPFFLEGVALKPELMQEDGLHPNQQAQPVLWDNVRSGLKPILEASGWGSEKPCLKR